MEYFSTRLPAVYWEITAPRIPKLCIMLVMEPEYRSSCFTPIEIETVAIPERENPNKRISIVFNIIINWINVKY